MARTGCGQRRGGPEFHLAISQELRQSCPMVLFLHTRNLSRARVSARTGSFNASFLPLPNALSIHEVHLGDPAPPARANAVRPAPTSLRHLRRVVWRRRRFVLIIEGTLLAACILYCIIAPNQYEAAGCVELRAAPVSSLNLD